MSRAQKQMLAQSPRGEDIGHLDQLVHFLPVAHANQPDPVV